MRIKLKLIFFGWEGTQPKMTKFQVTLNFNIIFHDWEDQYSYGKEDKAVKKARKAAYERTAKYYEEHSIVDHVKSNHAMGFVETVLCDGEVLSAEWDKERFAIHMVVETDGDAEELRRDLEMNSLEDGEYEACGETGWILMTRGPNGEVFGPPWDMKDTWEYALTDYRENPILIKEMGESV